MKFFLLVAVILLVGIPTMTNADEKELSSGSREIASISAKTELTAAQEKHRKELNAKIEKIILSEVKFKN